MSRRRILFLLSWRSIPELRNVPADERSALWQTVAGDNTPGWTDWLIFAAMMVGMYASIEIGQIAWKAPLWSTTTLFHVLNFAAWSLAGLIAKMNVTYRRVRAPLRALLRAKGRCSFCGYYTKPSRGKCPECGEAKLHHRAADLSA